MFKSERKIALVGFSLSIILSAIGYILANAYKFGICHANFDTNTFDVSCQLLASRIGDPLIYGMSALAIVFAMLFVFPKSFPAWKKFAVWAVPSIAILFALYTDPQSGDLFSPYAEQVYSFVSKAFVVISIAIIAITDYRTHSTSKKKR